MALTRLLVNQLTLLENKRGYNMIPNKKGLQVVIKGTNDKDWDNKVFTLTGEEPTITWGNVFYPVQDYKYPVNCHFMIPLNSLKLLILNKQEKEN